MKKFERPVKLLFSVFIGLGVGLLSFLLTVQMASASGVRQDDEPDPQASEEDSAEMDDVPYTAQECQECHLDVTNHWGPSAHANAFSDPTFQARWVGMGEPGECLTCHTTDYDPATGEYDVEGISCQACHGQVKKDHPSAPVPILADSEYCGSCHTTTLGEWHLTGHSRADIGCTDCHDPHSQAALFEDADELCLNCHEESMGEYLEGIHNQKGIGCVDCHALVIPPEVAPEDGIVPTGHAFTITPATCVACHTDALHSGFSLPGYEYGAKNVSNGEAGTEMVSEEQPDQETNKETEVMTTSVLSPEQQIQALQAALDSRNTTLLFQGAVVGLVLGGSTAWIVANNVRTRKAEEEESEDDDNG